MASGMDLPVTGHVEERTAAAERGTACLERRTFHTDGTYSADLVLVWRKCPRLAPTPCLHTASRRGGAAPRNRGRNRESAERDTPGFAVTFPGWQTSQVPHFCVPSCPHDLRGITTTAVHRRRDSVRFWAAGSRTQSDTRMRALLSCGHRRPAHAGNDSRTVVQHRTATSRVRVPEAQSAPRASNAPEVRRGKRDKDGGTEDPHPTEVV